MARPRTFLSDYNRMKLGFPFVIITVEGNQEHGIVYAHNADDARIRLHSNPNIQTLILLEGK